MWRQVGEAGGYLSIFLAPALLILGVCYGVPSVAFAVTILAIPLLRMIFGSVSGRRVVWSEPLATALHQLPLVYAVGIAAMAAFLLSHLALYGLESTQYAIGLGLSLWIVMLLSTCVSHELIHRRSRIDSLVGHCLAGLAGYPLLAQEHLKHHARSGCTRSADWPCENESAWQFAFRRIRRIAAEAYAPGSAFWSWRAGSRRVFQLRIATAISVMTAAMFAWVAGPGGLAVYVTVAMGVWFGVQLITYIQHWGLGDDRLGEKALGGYAWEDDCRFQAWLTLSISLHNGHHQLSGLPFYRVELAPDSPRLPAGYLVLLVLCLFPGPWYRLMRPVLEHWESEPDNPRSPGRRLTCFSLYGPGPAVNR
jgi:hypothetical protein